MRAVTLLWFLAASLAAQTGSVEGVVVNHTDGKPLSDAHLTFLVVDIGGGEIQQAYGAVSDRAGHFSVTGMPPGMYFVVLRRAGFVQERAPGIIPITSLALKAGQHVTDFKAEMTPRALITGRVVDEYGDPVQGVNVRLEGVTSDFQPVNMFGQAGSGPSDEHGEFRIVAAPGRYYLQASLNIWRGGPVEIRTDGSSGAPFAATYYPGVISKSQASVVEVGAGQDVTGTEIRLVRTGGGVAGEPTRLLTISGVVSGAPEGERPMVMLRFGDSATTLYSSRSTSVGPDGKFSIAGLEPKFYQVLGQYAVGKVRLQSQTVELHLTTSDASGLQLALAPGDDLAGSLEISGDPAAGGSAPKFSVHLEPTEFYGLGNSDMTTSPGKDGSFAAAGLFAGKYRVSIEPLPENAYVKSMVVNGAAVEGDVVDLSHGVRGARLKVSVGLNGGQLSGKVLDHDGGPLASVTAMVLVWKDVKQTEPDDHRIMEGRYSLKGLRPGKYLLLALDPADLLESFRDMKDSADIEKTMKAAAEEIEIKDGDRIVKDLKVADKEKLSGKAKQ